MFDLATGRIDLAFATQTTAKAFIQAGKMRPLATTLSQRSNLLPDVQTMAEAGMPQFSIVSWAALFGPAKLPQHIVVQPESGVRCSDAPARSRLGAR